MRNANHPSIPRPTAALAVANCTGEVGGTPWYLLDTSRVIKPLIFQERTKPELTAMNKPDFVFDNDQSVEAASCTLP